MKYCPDCAQALSLRVPEGDHLPRYVCDACGAIHYQNPRVIVGCLPIWGEQVLLCKRAIEPQLGLWNVPGGFLENGESSETGAIREVYEEAGIAVTAIRLLSIYDVVRANQIHIHYLAQLPSLDFCSTPESSEVRLFHESEIPWADIAFQSSLFSLRSYFSDRINGNTNVHRGLWTESWV